MQHQKYMNCKLKHISNRSQIYHGPMSSSIKIKELYMFKRSQRRTYISANLIYIPKHINISMYLTELDKVCISFVTLNQSRSCKHTDIALNM